MSTFKNWWFAIVGMVLIILDQGFEVLNPFLIDIGVGETWIKWIKLIFGLYGMYKLKISLPTQNIGKLEDMIQRIGGTQIPPRKDEK